jgi:hypothetical protein
MQAIGRSINFEKARAQGADAGRRPSLENQDSSAGLMSIARTRTSLSGTFARRRLESTLGSRVGFHSGQSPSATATEDDDDSPPEEPRAESYIAADDTMDEDDDAGLHATDRNGPPHEDTFALQAEASNTQLALAAKLVASLAPPSNAPTRASEIHRAAIDALASTQRTLAEFANIAHARDNWWRARLRSERARQQVWETSLAAVVRESAGLENELRTASRRAGSTLRARGAPRSSVGLPELPDFGSPKGVDGLPTAVTASRSPLATIPSTGSEVENNPNPPEVVSSTTRTPRALSPGSMTPTTSKRFSFAPGSPRLDGEDADTDDEDEFFDAIEANALPNLVISAPLAGGAQTAPTAILADALGEYDVYRPLRQRLAITSDDRPPMSLWAVLKGSIGKDLTKISFPVFFNEPTSMLQRMVGPHLLYAVYAIHIDFRRKIWSFLSAVSACQQASNNN